MSECSGQAPNRMSEDRNFKKIQKKSKKGLTSGWVFGIIVKRLTKDAKRKNEAKAAGTQSGCGV